MSNPLHRCQILFTRVSPILGGVMRGFDPRIRLLSEMMDCRVKPGNDDVSSIDCELTSFRFESILAADCRRGTGRPFPAAIGVLTGRLRAAWSL
jgi:hypothetical protein